MSVSVKLIRRAGLACAAGLIVAVIPSTVSLAAPNQVVHTAGAIHVKAAAHGILHNVVPRGAYDNCTQGLYCSFNGTNGTSMCLEAGGAGVDNWPSACRNQDESFANRVTTLVRLYFGPNETGPWACVDNGWYSNDLNKDVYTFNNGSGTGLGDEIWENVASSDAAVGSCKNPLPEDG